MRQHLYQRGAVPMDFNRDGLSDYPITLSFNGLLYWLINLFDGNVFIEQYGLPTDIPIYGDIEGDLVNQPGVVRRNVSGLMDWYLRLASGESLFLAGFGLPDDGFHLGDLNCDGKDDVIVSRAIGGLKYWYWRLSPDFTDAGFFTQFGLSDDAVFVADMTGDGCDELVVAQVFGGALNWFHYSPLSASQVGPIPWGLETDVPLAPIDFDGDRGGDLSVVRTEGGIKTGYVRTTLGEVFGRLLAPGTPCVGNFSGLTKAEWASFDPRNSTATKYDPAGNAVSAFLPNGPPIGTAVGPYCETKGRSKLCDSFGTLSDGSGGNLWKPFSDAVPGAGVVLRPSSFYGRTVNIEMLDGNDQVVAGVIRRKCCPNGGRGHWWFSLPTGQLAQLGPLTIRFIYNDGSTECFPLENAARRFD